MQLKDKMIQIQQPVSLENYSKSLVETGCKNTFLNIVYRFRQLSSVSQRGQKDYDDIWVCFNEEIKKLNRDFRQTFLGISPDARCASLYVMSHRHIELEKIVGKKYSHIFSWNRESNDLNKRSRIDYTPEKYRYVITAATAFLFSKYETVYRFQFQITALKCLFEFFKYHNIIDFDTVLYEINRVQNFEFCIIDNYIADFKLNTDRLQKKTGRKSNSLRLPDKQTIAGWIAAGMTQTQIKNQLAEQFNVSAKTIQRHLAALGLTKNVGRNKIH